MEVIRHDVRKGLIQVSGENFFILDYESTKTLKNWQESRHSLGGSKTLFGLGPSRSLEKDGRDFVPPFLLRSLGGRLSQQVTMYLWIQHNFRWCKSNYSLSYLCPCSCVLLNYNYKHGIFDYLLIVEQKQFHGLFRHKEPITILMCLLFMWDGKDFKNS